MWITTTSGLWLFDGSRFERFRPAAGQPEIREAVHAIIALPNGDVWVGITSGGMVHIANHQVTRFGKDEGLPEETLVEFQQDAHGVLYAAFGSSGIWRFDGKRWAPIKGTETHGGKATQGIKFDAQGVLWVDRGDGVFTLRPGSEQLVRTSVPMSRQGGNLIDTIYDKSIWYANAETGLFELSPGNRHITGMDLGSAADPGVGLSLFDRDGNLWSVTALGTLVRLPRVDPPATPQTMDPTDRLSGPVFRIWEDTEGDVWAVSSEGLDRFRANKVHIAVSNADGLPGSGLALRHDGGVWTANKRGVALVRQGRLEAPINTQKFSVIYRDPRGTVWLGGAQGGLGKIVDDRYVSVDLPDEIKAAGNAAFIAGLASDPDGALLVAIRGRGVVSLRDDKWDLSLPYGNKRPFPLTLNTDPHGRIWMGHADGRLGMVENNVLRLFGPSDGLTIGAILAVSFVGPDVWVGGVKGAALWSGGRFWPLHASDGSVYAMSKGFVEDDGHNLWINAGDGIFRIPAANVHAFTSRPSNAIDGTVLDESQGVTGDVLSSITRPAVLKDPDGKVWFSRSTHVYWVDPAVFNGTAPPPAVHVTAIKADGRMQPLEQPIQAGATGFEVDYTGPNLAVPERVRFQYRLDGVDKTWQDAGARRQAFYTNVPPGRRVFHVRAANADGPWSDAEEAVPVTVEPRFTQTSWFYGLCILVGGVLLWTLHRIRLRQISERLRVSLEARSNERERIARELHDTLLQSTQGLVLNMQVLASGLEGDAPARERIEAMLDEAEEVIAEGRDRVHDLRSRSGHAVDLIEALQKTARALAAMPSALGQAPRFQTLVRGADVALTAEAIDVAAQIGCEALRNAYAHSQATKIVAILSYNADSFALTVEDNGRGVDQALLDAGARPGHWGLEGMKERALQLGASLELASPAGEGVRVVLVIPARLAYVSATSRNGFPWSWLRSRWHFGTASAASPVSLAD